MKIMQYLFVNFGGI